MSRRPRIDAADPLADVSKPPQQKSNPTNKPRIAAADPFAALPNNGNSSSLEKKNPFPITTTTSSQPDNNARPEEQQQQQHRPPRGAGPPPNVTRESALFDPFFKPALKAHRGSMMQGSSSVSRPRQQQSSMDKTLLLTSTAAAAADSTSLSTARDGSTATTMEGNYSTAKNSDGTLLNSSGALAGGRNVVDLVHDALRQSAAVSAARHEQELIKQQQMRALTVDDVVQQWIGEFGLKSSLVSALGGGNNNGTNRSASWAVTGASFVRDRKRALLSFVPSISSDNNNDNSNNGNADSNNGDGSCTATTSANQSASVSPIPLLGHGESTPVMMMVAGHQKKPAQQQQPPRNLPFVLEGFAEVEWWDRPFVPAPSYNFGAVKQLPKLGGPTATDAAAAAATAGSSSSSSLILSSSTAALKKTPTVAYPVRGDWSTDNNNSGECGICAVPIAVITAVPRKVGWNPPDSSHARQAALNAALQNALEKMKTPEELRKERHARRVAAARDREDVQKQDRANQHNFGLTESIAGDDGKAGRDGATDDASNDVNNQPHDKLKMKHLKSNRLIGDLVDDPTLGQQLRAAVHARIQSSLEDDHRRHVEAKMRQIDHKFDVKRRHATTGPRIIAVRMLGVTEERSVQRLKLECKEMFLRGALLWIQQKFLVAVLVGGVQAMQKAEALFVRRAANNTNILMPGTNVEIVWGGVLSDFAFNKTFLYENSPFDRDGEFKKRPALAQDASSAAAKSNSAASKTDAADDDDYRGKYESVPVVRCDSIQSAKGWFLKHGLDWTWDAVAETPVTLMW